MGKAHAEMFVAGQHAALQNADSVLFHLRGLLGDRDINLDRFKALPSRIGLEIDDAYGSNEPIILRTRTEGNSELVATIVNVDTGQTFASATLERGLGEWQLTEFAPLSEGTYRATVSDVGGTAEPVSDIFVVLQN
jgi:hypothetical protein